MEKPIEQCCGDHPIAEDWRTQSAGPSGPTAGGVGICDAAIYTLINAPAQARAALRAISRALADLVLTWRKERMLPAAAPVQ